MGEKSFGHRADLARRKEHSTSLPIHQIWRNRIPSSSPSLKFVSKVRLSEALKPAPRLNMERYHVTFIIMVGWVEQSCVFWRSLL
ncbi:hypothetical protein TNCT_105591 [Trichonephila clavata]|uniref:Uncharacterized protein n=1 Tax=Trichonephila clavata TaxID=2740835 RepID=A0A8X6KN06_TRICU|nr:hypothetical protein TNCT_105591 [Trichonephila clavata]